jgi:hypothetical protein
MEKVNIAQRMEIEFNEKTGKFVLPSWLRDGQKFAVCNLMTGEITSCEKLRPLKNHYNGMHLKKPL